MLKNYFKIAFRNLFKHKVYSFINIFGLAVGIACCLLIGLYVQNEWSFDEFHSKSDRTYRVFARQTTQDGRIITNTSTPAILGPTLRDNIPEVEYITYVHPERSLVKTSPEQEAISELFLVVNSDFFEMFDFEIVKGVKESVFNSPSSVAISEETAHRFFGNDNPIQKVLSIRIGNEYKDFTVSAVLENPPSNSSLTYSMLMPYENFKDIVGEKGTQSWFNIYGDTYVTLAENADPAALNDKFDAMMKNALGEEIFEGNQYRIGLFPLADIHLDTSMPRGIAQVSDPTYIYILTAIAVLILLIACVNFMTLSISRSISRAKEVGIRKTIGAIRQHLMYQFWGEAFLMTVIAFVFGIVFAELLLPFFNELSGTQLSMGYGMEAIVFLVLLSFIISIIAGFYPALVLSGFRPSEALKGRMKLSSEKGTFQKFMVILQFSLSIALIIGTITIHQQMNYVQNKNLGYQNDEVVVLESGYSTSPQQTIPELFEEAAQRKQLLENKMGAFPEIETISMSSFAPIHAGGWLNMGFPDDQGQMLNFHGNIVDANFIPALKISMVEGRNFSADNPADAKRAIIINEAAADYFGWEQPLGQKLPGDDFIDHEVIGVVQNFHFESLHKSIEPLVLTINPEILFSGISNLNINGSPNPRYSIKFSTPALSETMSDIEKVWKEIAPATQFNYSFVDEVLNSQYRQEQRLSQIVSTGSLFAIVIACLGLFGLASLMVVRRTKEIGVRKVLGASPSSIILLVNKEFTKLVLIAFVIAVPVAWYLMSGWLENFAYRIDVGLGIILMAGISALAVAWLTVSYQSIKATLVNPVESLRSE